MGFNSAGRKWCNHCKGQFDKSHYQETISKKDKVSFKCKISLNKRKIKKESTRLCKNCNKMCSLSHFIPFVYENGKQVLLCSLSYKKNGFKVNKGASKGQNRKVFEFEDGSENKKYIRNKYLQDTYNITLSDYEQILKSQNNSCKICKKHYTQSSFNLCVDHCHKTGEIRGILCNKCNSALGLFKDSVILLQKTIDYLNFYD